MPVVSKEHPSPPLLSFAELAKVWAYGGKVVIIARNILNGLSRDCSYSTFIKICPCQLKTAVTYLKFFAIVGVPFDVADLIEVSKRTFKNWQLGHRQEAALGSLSISIISVAIFDSLTTFANAIFTVNKSPEILSWAGLPFGFYMSGAGSVSRTIQVVRAYNQCASNDPEAAVTKQQKLQLQKKIKLEMTGLLSNAFILSALALFKKGNATPLPPLLIATAFVIRLLALSYQNTKIKSD